MTYAYGRKTPAEGEKQLGIPLQADLAADQGPSQARFLRKKSEPRSAVGRNMYVWFANESLFNIEGAIFDCDRRIASLRACKSEIENSFETLRLVRLENEGHEIEQSGN